MIEAPAFLPGSPPTDPLPLDRYLPPVHAGSATRWLSAHAAPGSCVLDPFGASPALALELANSGYRILIAANNPVTRIVIEMLAENPGSDALTAALAHLAAVRITNERLEPHLLSLYNTPCNTCGQLVSADEFLWERDAETPFARIYRCPHCGDAGEYPATPFDADLAKKASATRLNYARILERVAGLNDRDRIFAEEALRYYPPRSVYALGILVNKIDTFPEPDRRLLSALYLNTFDRTNTLWPYPTPRRRPRQLTIPPRYRERNVFRMLEESIRTWSRPGEPPIPCTRFPEMPPESGGICIFEGAVRDLAGHLNDLDIAAVVSVMPRPSQAFWKMSALWAGWLGGRDAVRPFKPVLRRQRYDWRWHTSALFAALAHLVPELHRKLPILGLFVEAEQGLLVSGLTAGRHAGLKLQGIAFREEDAAAQVHWTPDRTQMAGEPDQPLQLIVRAAQAFLAARGEPSNLLPMICAVQQQLAASPPETDDPVGAASNDYTKFTESLSEALTYRNGFLRYNAGKDLEIGAWWLRNEPGSTPLADRVEAATRTILAEHPGLDFAQLDDALCLRFPGLHTPDPELIAACLESYADADHESGWQLRMEDDPQRRRSDVQQNRRRLLQLGEKLGFRVQDAQDITWEDADGKFVFHILHTAEIGQLLQSAARQTGRKLIVLPGSRANLVLYKRLRDPRLDVALKEWHFLKFRQLRALSTNPLLDRSNVEANFLMDELTYESPQLKLF